MINDPALAIGELKFITAAPDTIDFLDVEVIATLLSALSNDALGNEMVKDVHGCVAAGGATGFCRIFATRFLQQDSSNQSEIVMIKLYYCGPGYCSRYPLLYYFFQKRNGLRSSVFKLCCKDSAKPCNTARIIIG